MHGERSRWEMQLLVSSCRERKRAHPKMVFVHNQSQESSSIDLLEVGMEVVDPGPRPPFFFPSLRSRIFIFLFPFLLSSSSRGEKKVRKRVERPHPNHLSLTLIRSMTNEQVLITHHPRMHTTVFFACRLYVAHDNLVIDHETHFLTIHSAPFMLLYGSSGLYCFAPYSCKH
jgi:hypothetical protein